MNIVFMGTPDFAVPSLKSLIESKHNVTTVITQTDKPKGRKSQLCTPPVKNIALDSGLKIVQPENVNDKIIIEKLKEINPDVITVVAFGQKISSEILDLPRYKCINIHASLLPKYRGAAPINWALINGEEETGVTSIILQEKMDAGKMIIQKSIRIGPDETAGKLNSRLSILGAEVLIDSLKQIETGTAKYTLQDEKLVTYAPKLKKKDGLINWNHSTEEIHNFVRGMSPWPTAHTTLIRNDSKERIIILETEKDTPSDTETNKVPGTIIDISDRGIKVVTKNGCIWIKEVKPEGKQSMSAVAFSRGRDVKVNYLFR
ncbi:MAG: methionyl-tRNA formyltransferase [Planctomycetota bacterium]